MCSRYGEPWFLSPPLYRTSEPSHTKPLSRSLCLRLKHGLLREFWKLVEFSCSRNAGCLLRALKQSHAKHCLRNKAVALFELVAWLWVWLPRRPLKGNSTAFSKAQCCGAGARVSQGWRWEPVLAVCTPQIQTGYLSQTCLVRWCFRFRTVLHRKASCSPPLWEDFKYDDVYRAPFKPLAAQNDIISNEETQTNR